MEFDGEYQESYWLDRPDDYNVFEEAQIALDNEGGWEDEAESVTGWEDDSYETFGFGADC